MANEFSFDDLFEDDLFEDMTSDASGYWWNTYSLKTLEDIHDYLDSIPEIGKVLSVASGIKLAREINNGEDLNDKLSPFHYNGVNFNRYHKVHN